MKPFALIFIAAMALAAHAADFRWKAGAPGIVSTENGLAPEGYLWIDEDCDSIRALMFAFQNMNEETLMRRPAFRADMARAGVGLLWIAPGFGQEWDVHSGVQEAFFGLLDSLAAKSGHPEVARVPLVPFGHSAQATMPWNFAAWNPSRTLCIISYHGDAPRTNLCGYGRSNIEWGRTRNIDGIPGLMVMGEYEWWDARLRPALAFRMMYPDACISFLGDAGRGHFDLADETAAYIARFVEKSLEARLRPDGTLRPGDPRGGWLAARWQPDAATRPLPAPAADYRGCPHEAFWYFDGEMASLTEARYAASNGRQPSFIAFTDASGNPLPYSPTAHCKQSLSLTPDAEGRFRLQAAFTDSTRAIRSSARPDSLIRIRYVSGPAREVAPGVFEIVRDHPTWRNPRRIGRVTLCAEAPSDSVFKGAVQEIEVLLNPQQQR